MRLKPRAPTPFLLSLLALIVVLAVSVIGCGDGSSDAPTTTIACPGMTLCGESCVDVMADPHHCGGCDHACGDTQACSAGVCTAGKQGVEGDASLSALSFSSGALHPAFSPSTTVYALEGASPFGFHAVASTTDAGATLTMNGAPVSPGSPSAVQIPEGEVTPLTFEVTTPGGAAKTYTVLAFTGATTYVKASKASGAEFGWDIALSGDTLAVGAPYDASGAKGVNGDQNDSSAPISGAVYVFVRSGATWVQQAYIKASNTASGDSFGTRVALSGDTLAVGADVEASNATGVDGNQADNSASNAGAVYVFSRTAGVWSQQAYIKASNTGVNDQFGYALAISGDTLVVGAIGESSGAKGVGGNQADNSAFQSGAAYVFTRSGGKWSQQAYLKASNTSASDVFGTSVAISGDTIAVAATSESSNAVGINGDQTNESAGASGAVYVFTRSGTTWSQEAYVKASNTRGGMLFGFDVALFGDTLAVSTPYEQSAAKGIGGNQSDHSASDVGAVYVFTRTGGTWSQQAYIKASNAEANDYFGWSIALSDDLLAVGARDEGSMSRGLNGDQASNGAPVSGAAYIFRRTAGVWTQQAYVKATNADQGDAFGQSIAASGETVAVAAHLEQSKSTGIGGDQTDNSLAFSGAVYVTP